MDWPIELMIPVSVCAQTTVNKKLKLAQIDPNKFALIINGPGGEEAYTKQFEKWTNELRKTLSERYGFDPAKMRVVASNHLSYFREKLIQNELLELLK